MFLAVLWLAGTVAWIAAVIDAGNQPTARYAATRRSKGGTVALVVFTGWIGLIYYAAVIRPALTRVVILAPVDDGTKHCRDCGMSRLAPDATRCTNCGSERLAAGPAPRT